MSKVKPSVVFFFRFCAVIFENAASTDAIFEESIAHFTFLDWIKFRSKKEYLVVSIGVLRDCLCNGIEEGSAILVLITCH